MRLKFGILLKFISMAIFCVLLNLYLKIRKHSQKQKFEEIFEKRRQLVLEHRFQRKSLLETKHNANKKLKNHENVETMNLVNTDKIVDENVLLPETIQQLKAVLKCNNYDFLPQRKKNCDYWILMNYIRAEHGQLQCYETVTYTTHATTDFLDNVLTLVQRWNAPISIAIFTPGTDFETAVKNIRHLRDCSNTNSIRLWVTFHLFFPIEHLPSEIPDSETFIKAIDCSDRLILYQKRNTSSYKTEKHLQYPINVARNIAKDAALTHFVLASDSELYPSPNLSNKFLNMISRKRYLMEKAKRPTVFVIPVFEVNINVSLPMNKSELILMYSKRLAIPFHITLCEWCHRLPNFDKWIQSNGTDLLDIFSNEKRQSNYYHWEPFYIGTKIDPFYDESFTWEGKYNKMAQAYIMCSMDYNFLILNNAFLVHKPGIKKQHKLAEGVWLKSLIQKKKVMSVIGPQYGRVFKWTSGCQL